MEPTIELTPTVRKCTQGVYSRTPHISRLIPGSSPNERQQIGYIIRDYNLNTVCHDICVDETLKCMATCEPTDSECVSVCLRSEIVCTESKLVRWLPRSYRYNISHLI